MTRYPSTAILLAALSCSFLFTACTAQSAPYAPAKALPLPKRDITYDASTTEAEVVVAGGCFWCTEVVFEQIAGVTDVVSGYAGGTAQTANYRDVSQGNSTHAESIRISFNPQEISFAKVLQIFFTMHHPTQRNGQGPDIGMQYRSAFFFADDRQREVAAAYIEQLNQSDLFGDPVATTLEPLVKFYPAEDYHQDYVKYNPGDRYVVRYALPKIDKVRKLFAADLKDSARQ